MFANSGHYYFLPKLLLRLKVVSEEDIRIYMYKMYNLHIDYYTNSQDHASQHQSFGKPIKQIKPTKSRRS